MRELTGWGHDYDDLIDSFEVEVLHSEHEMDYQGDSYYLLRLGPSYGMLIVGWGSCGGCDALEACDNRIDALTELRDELWDDIHWEPSAQDMWRYIQTKDWRLEWMGHEEAFGEFYHSVREMIGEE